MTYLMICHSILKSCIAAFHHEFFWLNRPTILNSTRIIWTTVRTPRILFLHRASTLSSFEASRTPFTGPASQSRSSKIRPVPPNVEVKMRWHWSFTARNKQQQERWSEGSDEIKKRGYHEESDDYEFHLAAKINHIIHHVFSFSARFPQIPMILIIIVGFGLHK